MTSPTPQPDQTTQMLDSSNLQGMQPAAPAATAPAAPAKPSLWKTLLMGVIGGLAGSGQKTFAAGVGSGARAEQGLVQQDKENVRANTQLQSDVQFRNAEAANYTAEAALRQKQMDNASEQIRSTMEGRDAEQVKFLTTLGIKPMAVMENTAAGASAAMKQGQDASPDGKVPPVVTFHYGGKILAFNLDDLQSNPGVLQTVNSAGSIIGRQQIDLATWNKLPASTKNKLLTDSFSLTNPVPEGGQKIFGQIEYYKNLVAKVNALPDGTPGKEDNLKKLTEAVGTLQAAQQESEASQKRVATARGAAFGASRPIAVVDNDGNLVIQTAGQAEREGSAPAAQGVNAMSAQAQVNEIRTGSTAFRASIKNLDTPFTTDQVAKLTIAAHSNDEKVVGAALQSLASQNLTPAQKDYVVNYTQMLERIMSVRKMAGMGQGSDATRAAMQRTIPGPGSGDRDMALRKLDAVDQQINVLSKGIPKLKGRGTSQASAPAASPSGPAVGTVQGGYRFKGGDPSVQTNWEKQ